MHNPLYPSDWKLRAAACFARAGYRCEDCGVPHGVLRVGKKSKSPYIVYLHAAHVNQPAPARRQGYQLISASRLVKEARGAGLYISQQGDRYVWQIGDLTGIATDVLDAVGLALHCLMMERVEEVNA